MRGRESGDSRAVWRPPRAPAVAAGFDAVAFFGSALVADQQSRAGISLVSGDVDVWADQGPRENHLSAASGAVRGIYLPAGGPDGGPAVQFDGVRYLRKVGADMGGALDSMAFALVFRADAWSSAGRWLDYRSGSALARYSTSQSKGYASWTAVGVSVGTSNLVPDWHTYVATMHGTTRRLWIDGVMEDEDAGAGPLALLDGGTLSMGAANGGASAAQITVARSLVVRSGDFDAVALSAALAEAYGL